MTGTILTRALQDGRKRYDCVWRAGGKQRWKTFSRRKAAENFLTTTIKDVQDGTYTHVRPAVMGQVFDRWLTHSLEVREKQGLLKPSTAKSYRSMLDTHLRPAFGEYRSDRLGPAVISEWVRARADQIADGTMAAKFYNNLLNLLHAILAWARQPAQRYLAHDPLAGQQRLPQPKVERDFLEPREIDALLKAAEPPDDAILHVAIFTGLRRGELFGLQWGDLDWGDGKHGGQLRVQRSLYQGTITTPKTEHSIRTVDVPQRVLDILQRHRAAYPPLDGDFIFRTSQGTPLDPDNWYKRVFPDIRTRAGLRAIRLHALRHTYVAAHEKPRNSGHVPVSLS